MRKLILAAFVCLLPTALYAQAVGSTHAAVASVQDKSTLPPSPELAEAEKLSASVMQLYAAGKYKEALPLAVRVLELCEKVRGEEDPLVGSALNNLAVLHIALKQFGRAEPILERILARREKLKAATSPPTLRLLMSYGCIMSAKGVGKRDETRKVVDRINNVLFQDSVFAAGLPLPKKIEELIGGSLSSHRPQPRYPREALSNRLQGTVLIVVETDERGKITSAEALPCWSGQKLLADASVEAARAARFEPVLINGQPIKLKSIITYSFFIG